MSVIAVQADHLLPLDMDSTTELPRETTNNVVYIVIAVVIVVLFILIILAAVGIIVFLIIRRRKTKVKFEKNRYTKFNYNMRYADFCQYLNISSLYSRMLRAFDQPAGIMLTKQERQSMDMDKEEEVLHV